MFTVKEILEATGGKLIKGSPGNRISGVSIDSRTVKAKELFVPIKGTRFDGHNFIAEARRKRAGAIMFCNPRYRSDIVAFKGRRAIAVIEVESGLRALGALAHYYRKRFKIPVVAISGSNGKTTTKEMLSTILASRFNVLCNPGTQNTQIGISLALLRLRRSHHLALIEIGSNHAGEIDMLSRIVQPTVGIITNIGPSHLEFFKSLKGVFKAKLELIKNLAKNGTIIINRDDRYLSRLNGVNLRTITFGLNRFSDFWAGAIEQTEKDTTFLLNARHRIVLKAPGRHNVYNALASIALARNFGISYRQIKQAFTSFKPAPMRMQVRQFNNIKIIIDCYNANPQSFRCALDFLKGYPSRGKKMVVCGDMLELGKAAQRLHINLGKRVAQDGIDYLISVGPLAKQIAYGASLAGMSQKSIRVCQNSSEAAKSLKKVVCAGDIVLIKGSRAIKMEDVV